jgi:hypothetical protein
MARKRQTRNDGVMIASICSADALAYAEPPDVRQLAEPTKPEGSDDAGASGRLAQEIAQEMS